MTRYREDDMNFGTNGIRGLFNDLNPEEAVKIGYGIGRYLNGKILVARDNRLTGEILKQCVIAGVAATGRDVIDLGIVSSPTAELMIKKFKAGGLVIITASHNPPEWNAIKVVDSKGVAISKERGATIEKLMEKTELIWDKVGNISKYENATEDHIREIVKKFGKNNKKKVVLDCGNGTACTIAPKLFKELGCEIISINSHMDGRFPGRPSEPSEKNISTLIKTVISEQADAGIAWDADGDRVVFVDDLGRYVIGDKVFALSILFAENLGDEVVTTVATSKCVEDIARKKGLKIKYTAIGAPYLCEAMENAFMGGEEVGGVIWKDFSLAKDGFLTAAIMIYALQKKKLSEWLKEIPEYFNVKEKIPATTIEKNRIMEKVLKHAKDSGYRINKTDGLRLDFEKSWIIIRPSGTENYIRIFAEAKTIEEAEKLASEWIRISKED